MRISRVSITNFTNFAALSVETGDSIVLVGENKVGKSNFVRALQLILDPGLSERDRQLDLGHFWDGLGTNKLGATIEIAIELTDFDKDPRLMAHLADCIVDAGPPMVARLTYRFQPKANLGRTPLNMADYEYIIFGGDDADSSIGSTLRRMLPLDVQGALRDAEKDLATWRRSPLRPLIEELANGLDPATSAAIQQLLSNTEASLARNPDVLRVANRISQRLEDLAGPKHAVPIGLGLAPTRIDTLLRGLRLLIDGGMRGIGEASLGTANLIFLALKSLELDRLVKDGERDHTFFVVEEPEAHLHPHVQRLIYRYFLEDIEPGNEEDSRSNLTTIVTTHSPHIASVAPIRSIVVLRDDSASHSTVGVSTSNAALTPRDEADLQRYIDVTRGEMFFARGIVLVEGDAELFLLPAFAQALNMPLDVRGISICSVSGTNFAPYVKLLGPSGLKIPYVALTDRDPNGTEHAFCRGRLIDVLEILEPNVDHEALDTDEVVANSLPFGFFVNNSTLELELFDAGLGASMLTIIEQELSIGTASRTALQGWIAAPNTLDAPRLLGFVERIGKGRFAQALAGYVNANTCPGYIRSALERIRDAVA